MNDNDPHAPGLDKERFGFAWDIAMGLRQVVLYRGRGQRLTLADKMTLAHQILEHLRINGVILSRKPPIEGHGRRSSNADEQQ